MHSKLLIDIIDFFFSIAIFLNASLFIPQAIRILKQKHAGDLSLITFLGFNFIQLMIILYGLVHYDYLLSAGYSLAFLCCGSVTLLIFKYRKQSKM